MFGKRQKEGGTKDWLEVWSFNWESYQWEVCALCDITVAWLPELRVLNLLEEARDSLLFGSDATLSGCCIMWDSGAGCTRCFRNIGWSHNVLNYWSGWTHSPTLSAWWRYWPFILTLSQPSKQAAAEKPQGTQDCWGLNIHIWRKPWMNLSWSVVQWFLFYFESLVSPFCIFCTSCSCFPAFFDVHLCLVVSPALNSSHLCAPALFYDQS